jgi:GTP cyclohydrolase I
MTTRGIHKINTTTITKTMLGEFKSDPEMERKFLSLISLSSSC